MPPPVPPRPRKFASGMSGSSKSPRRRPKRSSSLLQNQGRPNGVLRVAVVGGGCSGLQYKMDLQDQPANRDILVESAASAWWWTPRARSMSLAANWISSMPCRTAVSRSRIPTRPAVAPAAKVSARSRACGLLLHGLFRRCLASRASRGSIPTRSSPAFLQQSARLHPDRVHTAGDAEAKPPPPGDSRN